MVSDTELPLFVWVAVFALNRPEASALISNYYSIQFSFVFLQFVCACFLCRTSIFGIMANILLELYSIIPVAGNETSYDIVKYYAAAVYYYTKSFTMS